MKWHQLVSQKRFDSSHAKVQPKPFRSEFQRDFDRIVFSNAFRRLQGKTQVFPLPDNDVIHNRLTHSLEVSCVGRSLGTHVGYGILNNYSDHFESPISADDFGAIVASACLIHDIGNPPFGHHGEQVIQQFFKSHPDLLAGLSVQEQNDFYGFDGNALGLRLLRKKEDFNLTCATLASFVKYPISSDYDFQNAKPNYIGFKKCGVFKSETIFMHSLAKEVGLNAANANSTLSYHRHPLNFLVEAADDICYHLIDLEDAYRSQIISKKEMKAQLASFIPDSFSTHQLSASKMRSMAIGHLVEQVAQIFLEKMPLILNQPEQMTQSLIEFIDEIHFFRELKTFSQNHIYRNEQIKQDQKKGKKILKKLLSHHFKDIPDPELTLGASNQYEWMMEQVEFIAGMTDRYAIKKGKKISTLKI